MKKQFINAIFRKVIIPTGLLAVFFVLLFGITLSSNKVQNSTQNFEEGENVEVSNEHVHRPRVEAHSRNYSYWVPYNGNEREIILWYNNYHENDYNAVIRTISDKVDLDDIANDGIVEIENRYYKPCTGCNTYGYPKYVGDGANAVITNSSNITRIVFASSSYLTHISDNAFRGNTQIEYIDLSNTSLTTIGTSAFEGCTNLKEVRLPSTVKTIGVNAFKDCVNLVSEYNPDNTWNYGKLYTPNVTSIGASAFENCKKIVTFEMPSITTIGNTAFKQCERLEKILIPASATSLGTYIFYGCTTLNQADVKCTKLSEGIFYDCSSLDKVTLNDAITTIPDYAFKSTLCNVIFNLPTSLVSIGNYAFLGSSVNDLVLPEKTTTLGNYAFSQCNSLLNIDLNNVTTIGNYAFAECGNMTDFTVTEHVTSIGDGMFNNC